MLTVREKEGRGDVTDGQTLPTDSQGGGGKEKERERGAKKK